MFYVCRKTIHKIMFLLELVREILAYTFHAYRNTHFLGQLFLFVGNAPARAINAQMSARN